MASPNLRRVLSTAQKFAVIIDSEVYDNASSGIQAQINTARKDEITSEWNAAFDSQIQLSLGIDVQDQIWEDYMDDVGLGNPNYLLFVQNRNLAVPVDDLILRIADLREDVLMTDDSKTFIDPLTGLDLKPAIVDLISTTNRTLPLVGLINTFAQGQLTALVDYLGDSLNAGFDLLSDREAWRYAGGPLELEYLSYEREYLRRTDVFNPVLPSPMSVPPRPGPYVWTRDFTLPVVPRLISPPGVFNACLLYTSPSPRD